MRTRQPVVSGIPGQEEMTRRCPEGGTRLLFWTRLVTSETTGGQASKKPEWCCWIAPLDAADRERCCCLHQCLLACSQRFVASHHPAALVRSQDNNGSDVHNWWCMETTAAAGVPALCSKYVELTRVIHASRQELGSCCCESVCSLNRVSDVKATSKAASKSAQPQASKEHHKPAMPNGCNGQKFQDLALDDTQPGMKQVCNEPCFRHDSCTLVTAFYLSNAALQGSNARHECSAGSAVESPEKTSLEHLAMLAQ